MQRVCRYIEVECLLEPHQERRDGGKAALVPHLKSRAICRIPARKSTPLDFTNKQP